MDIIVLAGGLSTERDVSFKTGSMVASALKENGHRVILLDVFMGYSDKEENLDGIFDRADEISVKVDDIPEVAPDLAAVKASRKDQSPCFFGPNVIRMCQMADIVFMALHGENGENGKLQAAFDLLGVKYTGSDYLSSAIAMNKGMAKQLFASAGIPAPRGIAMKKENREDDVTKLPLTLPCVVKPCCGGSSIGVTIVRDAAEFKKALDEAFHWEDELVIEEYVKGREFSVGVIQVGARNMQNFDLLKQLGKTNKPILLKRGIAATIEEWLMSAEYIMAGGNENVILCERGIRTYENYTRNTLDLSAIPVVKRLSHLPIIVDPSHAAVPE